MTAIAVAGPHKGRVCKPIESPYTSDQAAFFRVLGHNGGAQEIVAGKPDTQGHIQLLIWTVATFGQPGHVHTREWIEEDEQRKAARHIAEQVAEWGNVYTSVGTYAKVPNTFKPGKMRYCRDVPLPRHCFALDDVRDLAALRLRPTMVVETSPGNYQPIYRCDELLIPSDAVKLGAGAALLAGSDTSASDAEQLIRIPGTRNTKPKCGPDGWTVRLVYADGPTYSREHLARAFLPNGLADLSGSTQQGGKIKISTGKQESATIGTGDELWRKPQYRDALDQAAQPWRGHLEPNGLLLNKDGIPRRLIPFLPPNPTPAQQAKYDAAQEHTGLKILRGELRHTSTSGNWDASRDRWHVIRALMLYGYSDGEIAAIAEKLANFGEGIKSTENIWNDICRVICLNAADLGTKRRINVTQGWHERAAPERTRVERAKRGRPKGERATQQDRLIQLVPTLPHTNDGWHVTTRAQIAALLTCKVRMASHYLASERGIRIETQQTRHGIAIRLLQGGQNGAQKSDETGATRSIDSTGQIACTGSHHSATRPGSGDRNDTHRADIATTPHTSRHLSNCPRVEEQAITGARKDDRDGKQGSGPSTGLFLNEQPSELRVAINSPAIKGCNCEPTNGIAMLQTAGTTDMEITPAFVPPLPAVGDVAGDVSPTHKATPTVSKEMKAAGCDLPARAQPEAEAAPLSQLRTLVREAFDVIPRAYVNPATGELGKITLKRVAACLEEVGAVPDVDELAALVQEERYRRQEQTLRTLSLNGLRAQLRTAEHKIAQGKQRGEDVSFWWVWADKVRAEMRLRPAEPDEVKQRRRKGGPAKPDQRVAAQQYEADLFAQLDVVLGRAPVEQPQTDVQPQPEAIYGPSYAWSMIERLKQRKEQVAQSA